MDDVDSQASNGFHWASLLCWHDLWGSDEAWPWVPLQGLPPGACLAEGVMQSHLCSESKTSSFQGLWVTQGSSVNPYSEAPCRAAGMTADHCPASGMQFKYQSSLRQQQAICFPQASILKWRQQIFWILGFSQRNEFSNEESWEFEKHNMHFHIMSFYRGCTEGHLLALSGGWCFQHSIQRLRRNLISDRCMHTCVHTCVSWHTRGPGVYFSPATPHLRGSKPHSQTRCHSLLLSGRVCLVLQVRDFTSPTSPRDKYTPATVNLVIG